MGVTTRGERRKQAQQGQGMTTNNSTVSSATSDTIAATATGGDEAAGGRGRGAMTATKPKGKPRAKAPQPRTNARGRGRKPSSTAASTTAVEVAVPPAEADVLPGEVPLTSRVDDLLIFTPDDLVNLSEEEQKAKLEKLYKDLGIHIITEPIPSSMREILRACLRLETSHVNELLKKWELGCKAKTSSDILIIADYVRKALFPAENLEGIPPSRLDGNALDDISLRRTFQDKIGLRPQSGNGVSQQTFKDALRKQLNSLSNGGNLYYTHLSNNQLKDRLEGLGVKRRNLPNNRTILLRHLWEKEPNVSLTTVVNSGNDLNAQVNVPATPAPSVTGRIGSDVNANAAVLVPPTPIQGNQQNGNAVAPPPVDTNGLLTILMEQQRRNDEERRRYEEDMKEERRRNDEERRRNDEERLRNDDKFQTQSNQISEQNNNIANLVKEMAGVKPRLNTLETGFAKMETRQDALDTRQNTLETEHRNDISALEARLRTVEKKSRGRYSFGDTPDSKGGTSDDDGVKDGFIPKVLDFSEGTTPTGKVSEDPAEELKCALLHTFSKHERFYFLRQQLQQTTSLSNDTLEHIVPEMLRVFGSSEYSSEFMFELMALLPSVAGVLGKNFQKFLLDTLCMFENMMENLNKDDTEPGLKMKNLLLKSYMKLIHLLKADDVLASMIEELEDEKENDGVHHVYDGILYLTSKLTQPVTLAVPGNREFVEVDKARDFFALWKEQLADHRRKVGTILDGNVLEKELWKHVVLCDQNRLSGVSFSDEAAEIIAAFLKEPAFMDGPSVASGILCAQLADMIAGRPTDVGLNVLRTICDAFADAELVDVDLSDNAIGQQGIWACKTVLSKPSLTKLTLCNNGLSEDTMKVVADILIRSGCVANLTKVHFYNNMSGEEGCKEFARILEKSSKLIDIRFSSTRAGKAGSEIVASALGAALEEGRNANLEKLDLCDNSFGNEASQDALFRALGRTTSLSYLDLRDCDLEDDGVKRVCHALSESDSTLKHLDLSGNNVERQGAKEIADYIRNSKGELKVFCLDDNDLTSKGVVHIASAFHGSEAGLAIETLQLNCTMCGAIGARALIDAASAGKLPNLKKICLDGNYFKEDIVGELQVAFGDKLEEMKENDSDGEGDDDLADDNVPYVADDNGADDDSELANALSRLSMNSS